MTAAAFVIQGGSRRDSMVRGQRLPTKNRTLAARPPWFLRTKVLARGGCCAHGPMTGPSARQPPSWIQHARTGSSCIALVAEAQTPPHRPFAPVLPRGASHRPGPVSNRGRTSATRITYMVCCRKAFFPLCVVFLGWMPSWTPGQARGDGGVGCGAGPPILVTPASAPGSSLAPARLMPRFGQARLRPSTLSTTAKAS